jgi:hypothetical protein
MAISSGHQTNMWLKNLKNIITKDTIIKSFVVPIDIYFQTFHLPLFIF